MLDEKHSIDIIVTAFRNSTKLRKASGNNCISLEPFLEGIYVNYNNNCGYVKKNDYSAMNVTKQRRPSLFTFGRSQVRFLVCDLQYKALALLLTDPAIHTKTLNGLSYP